MSLKAQLKVQLLADGVLIAESEDPAVWYDLLRLISGAGLPHPDQGRRPTDMSSRPERVGAADDALTRFAAQCEVLPEEMDGACSPSAAPPYIHLNAKYVEAFKRSTPPRGPSAVPLVTLAATLLAHWFRALGKPDLITTADCLAVLDTVHSADVNAARALRNAIWLRKRPEGWALNPAETSRGLAVIRAYCHREGSRPGTQR